MNLLCFDYYFKKITESSFYCNKCKKTHKGKSYENIYRPPKILVLILDRGHEKNFEGEVGIQTNLDLGDYIKEKENEYSYLYKLICISTHEGKSSSSGHYTARCLTDNNKYYYFSDTYVEEINEDELYEDEPYLLFYQQINVNENSKEINNYENDNNKYSINRQTNENNINSANNTKNQKLEQNQNEEINKENIGSMQNNDKKFWSNNINKQNKKLILYTNNENITIINKLNTDNSNLNNKNKTDKQYNKNNEIKSFNNNKKNEFNSTIKNYKYIIDNQIITDTFKKFHNSYNDKYTIDYVSSSIKNPFNWKLIITGPTESLYKGGKYIFNLDFSKGFNKLTDHITIQNEFYHLNFGNINSHCLFDFDYNDDIPFYDNLKELFKYIYNLFKNPNCEISNNNEIGKIRIKEYINNKEEYNKKVIKSISYMLKMKNN